MALCLGRRAFGAANPFWGAAGLGQRFLAQLGPVGLGVDGAGHGFTFYNPDSASLGAGGTLVGMPVVTLGLGATKLELRSGARHYTVGHLGVRHSRTLHESDARVILRPTATVEV